MSMKPPSVIYHDGNPLIACYAQVASQEECQQLIHLAKKKLQPSAVVGNAALTISEVRKSDQAHFEHYSNADVQQICERIAAIVGQPLNHAEQLQIVRYQVGGKFDVHFDSFNLSTKLGKEFYSRGGQRIITAILYLNTVSTGGETFFPELSLEIAPSQGNLLVFENCRKETNQAHPLSKHGSRPIKEGEKWIATLWFRENHYTEYRSLYRGNRSRREGLS